MSIPSNSYLEYLKALLLKVSSVDTGVGNRTTVARFGRSGAAASATERAAGFVFEDGNNPTVTGGVAGTRPDSTLNYKGGITLYVNSSGSATDLTGMMEALKIDYDGNTVIAGNITTTGALSVGSFNLSKVDTGVGNRTLIATFGRSGAAQSSTHRYGVLAFKDGNNDTLVGGIGGWRGDSNADFWGGVTFYTNTYGGATTAAHLTEVARFTPEGRLIIGTTTDDAVNKLQVNGSIASTLLQVTPAAAPGSPVNGNIFYDSTAQKFKKHENGVTSDIGTASGSGDVVGPAVAVANNFAVFDGTTGKLIKDGGTAGTAASKNTGTSGGTVPLLNTANTWAATQTFQADIVVDKDSPALQLASGAINWTWKSLDTDGGGTPGDFQLLRTGTVILDVTPAGIQTHYAQELALSAAAGTPRNFAWETAGSLRLALGVNAAAESGSNAGSNMVFAAYDDTGTLLGNFFSGVRSTQVVTFSQSPVIPTAAAGTNNTQAASTAFVQAAIASARTVKKLAAAHTNSTTTLTTITDGTTPWSFSVEAGSSYLVKVVGSHQAGATTTGIKLAVTGSGGAVGTIAGSAWAALAQATVATGVEASLYTYAGAAGAFVLSTGVSPANSPHNCGMEFVFNCTTSGTLAIQFASEVAAAAQLNIGSALIIDKII